MNRPHNRQRSDSCGGCSYVNLLMNEGVTEITLPKMIGNLVLLFPLLCSTAAALQMTGPPTYTASVGSIAHIPCTFTADKLPADLRFFAVFWYLEGKMILSSDDTVPSTHPRYSLDKYRALYGIADLIISNAFLSDSGVYTCSVTYNPYRTNKEIRVEISAAALQMTGPSTYTARVGSIAHIPCTFTADKLPADPKYFAVFWYLEGKRILSYDDTVPSPDPRYSMDKSRALYGNADLTISNAFVSDGGDYTCSVIYSYFQMEKEIRVEISARPLVSIPSKSVQRNTENTLTCMVSGFFPSDILVTWYKDGEVLKNQLMGKPHKNHHGTFQVISTVTVTPSDDDQNTTFSCRVQHVSLQEPLQEDFQLIFQESSSHSDIVIVILLVVIIAVIIGIILWKRKRGMKAPEKPITIYKYTSAMYLKGSSGQHVGDNTWSFKNMEKIFLSTIKGRLPDLEIGEITGPINMKGNPRLSLSPDKRKSEFDVSTEEDKDQCTESSTAENSKPQSSEQERICKQDYETVKESIENKPQCHVTVEDEDNTDTVIAMDRSSSKLEPE